MNLQLNHLHHRLNRGLVIVAAILMSWAASEPVSAQPPICAEHPTEIPARFQIPTEGVARSTLNNGGIGGTGDKADAGDASSGLGVGVIGMVTGFASICLNGQEIHYDRATPVTRNGLPAQADALAMGQIVAIDAIETSRGLVAREIHLMNVLEGPITHVKPGSSEISVMNQPVLIDASTRLDGLDPANPWKAETPVRVSGFRTPQGQIQATRIEIAPNLSESSQIGLPGTGSTGEGSHDMLVRGRWNGHQLEASSTRPSPSVPVTAQAQRVIVEGLVLESRSSTHLRITGFDVSLDKSTHMPNETLAGTGNQQPLVAGQRIQITGHMDRANHIMADTISFSAPRIMDPSPRNLTPRQSGSMPADRPMMMERMSVPDMPQRMNSTPMPRPKTPPKPGMPQMPMM